jgi:hypothetical protein
MQTSWLLDNYIVLAGDVALLWTGRGYNSREGKWETVSGGDLAASDMTKSILTSLDVRIITAGGLRDGCRFMSFVMGDPQNRAYVVPWFQGIQSKGNLIQWTGRQPMLCGFVWRIMQGGLVAGDTISIGVGYE